MFSLANWSNPETFMLNLMNAALGLAVIYLVGRVLAELLHGLLPAGSFRHKPRH